MAMATVNSFCCAAAASCSLQKKFFFKHTKNSREATLTPFAPLSFLPLRLHTTHSTIPSNRVRAVGYHHFSGVSGERVSAAAAIKSLHVHSFCVLLYLPFAIVPRHASHNSSVALISVRVFTRCSFNFLKTHVRAASSVFAKQICGRGRALSLICLIIPHNSLLPPPPPLFQCFVWTAVANKGGDMTALLVPTPTSNWFTWELASYYHSYQPEEEPAQLSKAAWSLQKMREEDGKELPKAYPSGFLALFLQGFCSDFDIT